MKTKIISIVVMLMMACNVMGEDLAYFYLNNGRCIPLPVSVLSKMEVSKIDMNNIQHSDYQTQKIVTNDTTVFISLSEIDSIVFDKKEITDYPKTEKEIKESIDLSNSIASKSKQIVDSLADLGEMDINVIVEEIRKLDGVIVANADSSQSVINIIQKDGICINKLMKIDESTYIDENEEVYYKSISPKLSPSPRRIEMSQGDNASYLASHGQALILAPFQSSFGKYMNYFREQFEYAYDKGPIVYENHSADILKFKGDNLSKYDFLFIDTHGGCGSFMAPRSDYQNGWVSWSGWSLSTNNSTVLLSRSEYNYDFVDHYVNKEKLLTWDQIFIEEENGKLYVAMDHSFIDGYSFDGCIVFASACLAGRDKTSDTSLMKAFLDNGAALYAGFEVVINSAVCESIDTGIIGLFAHGVSFQDAKQYWINSRYLKKTVDTARETGLCKEEELDPQRFVYRVNPKLSNSKIFLKNPYPSLYSAVVDKETIGFAWETELEGFTTYSQTVELVNFQERTIKKNRFNVQFNLVNDLYVDGKLYKCANEEKALTIPANEFSVGDHSWYVTSSLYDDENNIVCTYSSNEEIFTIPEPIYDLGISQNSVVVNSGSTTTVEITSGNGDYTVSVDKPSIATATLSGTTITIEGVAKGTAKVTVKDKSGQTAEINVTVKEFISPYCPDNNHPHLIDLGLPSGTLWACCNVEATSPELSGGYYAWGETNTKDIYSWNTYSLCNGTKSSCRHIGDDIAGTEYDVAHVKWGGQWVMPSKEQIRELLDNCTQETITLNGVNGTLVNGKNGSSIFMPFSGFRSGGSLEDEGTKSDFWSSSLYPSNEYYAYHFFFQSASGHSSNSGFNYRYYGFSVRPIVSRELKLSQNRVEIFAGKSATVDIISGSGNYTVSELKSSVATASLSGTVITINGVGAGTTLVNVEDKETGQKTFINVTVNPVYDLVISQSSVGLLIGRSCTLEITSGNGSYEISNSNQNVVKAVLDGKTITLTAIAEGTSIVTVKDKVTDQTASVSVTVTPIPNLVVSQSTIDLTVGAEGTVEIVSGSGEYSVAVDKPSIATVSLSGSVIKVKGLKSGSASVTITDTASGQNRVLFVNVSLSYVPAEAIDLGLPSGTKWASWNVGATAPEEAGGYYAWGETEEKDYYDWNTYSLYDESSSTFHYIGNDIAGTEYDVAHVKWGGSWRMPTNDQINELLNNCTWTWTTRNEVDGELVTGPNGATIFLPAADRRVRDIGGDASRGYYWTSLVDPSVIGRAYALDFYNVNNNRYYSSNEQRRMGCSVRPVYSDDPPQNLSISADCIIMDKGDTTIVKITSGSGRYELTNTNNNIIVANINYSEITVIAKASGRAVLTVKDTYSDQTAEINVLVVRPISYVPAETVDLGLPSGTLWASWNVGAASPEDIGGYYAWGETEEKDSYDWSTYIHCDGTGETYHNIGDDISGTEYDVAHVKWGGSWRMPSLDQIYELTDNCTQLWTTQNGVKGMLLTGPSGKSIFLPASGYRRDSHLHNGVTDGLYWSSLLYTDNKYAAIYLHFASDVGLRAIERCFGLSVRPVINGLAISDNNIELMYGNSTTVEIISGSGNYEISNSDANVVQAVLNGTTITLTAKAEGRAILTVKDIKYGQTVDISINVNLATISVSKNSVKLSVGKSSTVEITSGNGSYELSNSNEDIVQAVIDSTTITLTAIADGNAIVTIKDVISGETIDLSVNVIIYTPSEPIDLGLPSGTKWASWNVGASKPEEYGGYYAWGETEEKDVYDWSSYIHCDGTGQTCHNIGTDIAGTEYDAAQVNWGGPWRMPTKDQMGELASKCTREWTQQNGVNGFLVTGPNGNTIFLPAAGFWEGGEHKRGADEGEYWSSTFDNYYMNRAFMLHFSSDHFWSDLRHPLYYGYTVRPVISKLIISKQKVGLIVGNSTTIEITSGSGTYEISNSNEDIVHAVLDSTSITLTAIADGKGVVTVKDFEQTIDINVYVFSSDCPVAEAIDLGLPSGTKWASWNVGAFFPEEYGAHYAWGETEEKDVYDWSTYKWCNGSDSTMTKYCTNSDYGYNGFTDGLTELLPEDDAATVNWGAPWHMPTYEQIIEFKEYCTSEWTQLNGVGGRLYVGPNGNTIFLPYGIHVSSSLSTYNENSVLFLFNGLDGFTVLPSGSADRYHGFMVRPVCP